MARTRCYRDGVLADQDFPLTQVTLHLRQPDTLVWIHLASAGGGGELAQLADELGLHELAVEDATNPRQRPKLDLYPDHLFLSAYAVEFEPRSAGLRTREIAAFVTSRTLITVSKDDGFEMDPVLARWDDAPDRSKHGVGFLLHGLLDCLADGYSDVVEVLDGEVEDLEEELFDPRDRQDVQRRSFALRKSLVRLRRVVLPMREVLSTLQRPGLPVLDDDGMNPYFQDVSDHVLRAVEWSDSLRDQLTSILDTSLTIQGNRLNVTTKKVTGYAAIIAVPTAITGFYGQNVPYPGFSQHSGFYASTVLMVGLSALLYYLFRRNDWL